MQQADYKQTLVSLPLKTMMRTTANNDNIEDGVEDMHNATVKAIQMGKKIVSRLEGSRISEDGSQERFG
jgi:hypothetical protein